MRLGLPVEELKRGDPDALVIHARRRAQAKMASEQ